MNKSRGGRFLSWLLAMLLVLQLVPAGTIASRAEGSSATSESAAATEETGSQEPVSSPTADDPAAEPADENLEAGEAGDEQQPTDAPSEEQPADAAADAPESEDAAETGEESVSADPIEEAAVAEPVEPDATAEPIPEEEPSEPVATVEPVEADPTPAAGEAEPVEPPVEPSATADPTESSAAASAGPMRIVIPPEPADTYVFYDGGNPPSELRRQTVVAGDTLIQPATLPSGVDGSTFLGWYANGTKLDFGAEGKLVITTVTGGAEITVTPKFSTVYHVTFFDEDNITVLSRRPVELAEGATSGTLAFDDLTVSSTNPYKEFAYWATAPDGGTRVDSPVTVTGDLDLYPVFSTGYWITFDANRTPAMSGVNVDYTPPQFVREGEATVAPVTPNSSSPAFVFAGWYTDAACTQPYTFGGTISANLTLYASWTETEVPFKIVVWTQDVSDDKDASDANKTYNSYAVYDSNLYDFLKAAAGSTVSLSQNAGGNYYYQSGGDYVNIATPAGRFVLNTAKSNTSATVAADGSTTLSLYYDRSLLTIHFYANGHAGQGAVTQDFTGLYGQTLAENGYTWPAVPGLKWTTTTTGGTTATFLDSFNFDEWSEATNNRTVLSLYANNDNGTKTINHFQQNLDGVTYPTTPANTSSGGGTFNISNKYTGFTAAWYRVNNGAWRQAVAGVTTVPNYNTLDIRYTRNSYTVDFYDGNQRLADLQMTKLFQAPLADVGSVVTDPANPAQYTFGGWAWVDGITNPEQAIDFTSMTMPPNNLTVYAIWVPVAYHVVLDVNGGTMDPAQATSFWPNYGEKIDGTWMNQATKARYVLVGWYSNHGAGTAWNFGNGITAALCDEGPTYDPDYQNYYYTVYLTAKWRLNETISINYVLPEGGTGTFVDPQRYVQDGSATILDDMPGHTNENYQFSGWLDAQGNLYQPGDTITLTEDLIETEVGQTPTVTLIAQFTTKVPTATITYRPNGGDGSDLLTGPYVWNESVALNGDTTFTRSGYKLIGWNSDQAAASSGVVEFACGASALVSAMGTTLDEGLVGNNDLYAVWTPVLTVTSGSQSWTYDGSSHTYQQYTLLYGDETISGAEGTTSFTLSDGIVVTITPTGSGAAGVTNVADSASNNNTFSVSASAPIEQGTHVMGTLTITKRAVTLTSATDSKVYDGTALTNSTVTVSGDGLADGEGATWDVTGTQTEVGTSNNTFTYTLNEGTLAENYDITTVEGTLTVTALTDTVTVTITENSGTELYDGSEKTVTGYTVAIDNPLYTEADFTFSGDATVSGTNAGTYDMALSPDDFSNISANFANVTFVIVDGSLTMTKRAVTLTSATDSKVYDGTPLTNPTVTISGDGFATGEGAAWNVTGTQTEVGTSNNTFTYTLNEGTLAQNYDITTVEGTLEVTPVTDLVTVTITENSGTELYDGSEKTVTGYTVAIDNPLYTEADFTFSGDATVSGTNAGTYDMALSADDFSNISANFANVTFVIVDGSLTMTKRAVTLTSATDSKVYDGTPLTNPTVTVSGDGFATGEGAAWDVTGTQTEVGTSDNTFTYTLNEGTLAENYDITTVEGTLTVTALTDTVTVTITENSGTELYDGSEKTVTGYTVAIDNPLYTEADFTFSGDATVSGTNAGTYDMALSADDFSNISANFANVTFVIVDGSLTITKRAVTLTSATDSKVYDGTPLTNPTVTVSGDGFATGEGAAWDVTGTQTEVGTSDNTFTYTLNEGTLAENYDITTVEGTLTVTALTDTVTVTITENSGTELYDGSEKTVTGYTVAIDNPLYTEADFTFSGDATVSGTNAGTYDMALSADDFSNISANFANVTFVIVDGSLTITKRAVTLTSATDSKMYDGTPLTNPTVTVSGDGFATGEGAAWDVIGTQTEVGTSNNTFTYTLNEGTLAENYDITTVEGTLTVTALTDTVTVTITENSGTELYDGSEKTVTGYTVAIDNPLYTEADFTFSGDATVSGTNAGTYDMALSADDFSNISANFANVTFVIVDGSLTITKRAVTLTSATDSKMYDGTPLTNPTVTVSGDGFATGEGAAWDVIGTQTEVGTSDNTFTYTLNEGTLADNYDITTVEGTLTVTALTDTVTVTITENSGTELYDGSEKTVTGYTVAIDNPLYTEADFTFSGDATVSGTNAGTYDMALSADDFSNISANFANVTFVIVDGSLTITKRAVTLTSATDSKMYDGTPLTNPTVTVSGDGFATGEGAAWDVIGTQTEVGTSNNTFTYTLNEGTLADNYDITTVEGTLTVTALTDTVTVTITENSGTELYDGSEKTVTGYTVAIDNPLYTEADFTFSGDATVSGTNAGTYDMALSPDDFSNISANFANVTFVIVDDTLTITKRAVTLTSATDSKVYDGTALTNSTVTVSGDGFADGEGATWDVIGTQTEVGTSNNTFTYTLNEGTLADNYDITTVEGTLEVTPVTDLVTVTITENSGTELYDGSEKTVTGYTVAIDNPLYTEADFTFSGDATVSGTNAGTYDMALSADDFSNISANFANVTFVIVDGSLTITKRAVTLTSATDSKVYDGTALTNSTVTVSGDGFATGEGATWDVTGTQTEVGTSNNTFTYTLNEGTLAQNYDITTVEGTLEVTPVTDLVTVTITGNNGTEKYDGLPKTVSGYTVDISNPLYTEADYTFSGIDSVNGLNVATYLMGLAAADFANISPNFTNVEFVVVDGALHITKRVVTLTSATDSKVYDGTPLTNPTVTIGGDGFADGEGATFDVTGSQTRVGSSSNSFTYMLNGDTVSYPLNNSPLAYVLAASTLAGNYDITVIEGTLTVTPVTDVVTVTITGNSGSAMYDGTVKTVTGYTVTIDNPLYTEADFTFSGTDAVSATNAGSYPMGLTADAFANNNPNFANVSFVIVDGGLEITRRAVTLTSATDNKVYDGTPLMNPGVAVSGDGFANGDGALYDVTGSQTEVGTSKNTFSYSLSANTLASNYVITRVEGTLTVTEAPAKPAEPAQPAPAPAEVKTGSLTISKIVTGDLADQTKYFAFTIVLDAAGDYGYTGSASGTISSGGTIQLKHGDSITIAGLPAGTRYSVTESGHAGYRPYASGDTGVIVQDQTSTAAFTNTRSSVPMTGDTSDLGLWLGIMGASFSGMLATVLLGRRRRRSSER